MSPNENPLGRLAATAQADATAAETETETRAQAAVEAVAEGPSVSRVTSVRYGQD